MKSAILLLGATLALAAPAHGASPKKAVLLDFSNDVLIDQASAKRVLEENIPAKVWKVYPVAKWGFVSQVEGGITPGGTCVVTARVMFMPLTSTKAMLFRPEKTSTAYDAQPGVGADQCRKLALAKLGEATKSVVSSLVKA